MMFGEEQAIGQPIRAGQFRQFIREQFFLKKLLLEPERNRHTEGAEAAWGKSEISFEQPFEFQERFVVECDLIDFIEIDPGFFETVMDCPRRKRAVVPLAREA